MTESSRIKNAERGKRWAAQNKERAAETKRNWYHKNKEISIKRAKERYMNTIEQKKIYDKEYNIRNREQRNKKKSAYLKKFRQTNHLKRLGDNLRHRVWSAIKENRYGKKHSTQDLLGAPIPQVKQFIEDKFKHGMSWENYGEWHIDHIIPLASAKSESELLKLFHYSNLQPLWEKENLSKGKKIILNNAA